MHCSASTCSQDCQAPFHVNCTCEKVIKILDKEMLIMQFHKEKIGTIVGNKFLEQERAD